MMLDTPVIFPEFYLVILVVNASRPHSMCTGFGHLRVATTARGRGRAASAYLAGRGKMTRETRGKQGFARVIALS